MIDDCWNPTPRADGEVVWRFTHGGRTASCELYDDSPVGAGWEVLIYRDDEIVVSLRCQSEAMAVYYTETYRQDYARSGWTNA